MSLGVGGWWVVRDRNLNRKDGPTRIICYSRPHYTLYIIVAQSSLILLVKKVVAYNK